MDSVTVPKAKKVRVLTDARVIADVCTWRRSDLEEYAKRLEQDCRDFVSHCKDHRSLDHISLEVERVYEDQCSACYGHLEVVRDPDLNDARPSCASCGIEVES